MAETAISISNDDDSTSSTELFEELDEGVFREEIRKWLEINGTALFHVEALKWLAKESRKRK